MPPLTGLERLLERLLERPSARLFRTHVQPIQMQHRIERAMERERRAAGDRVWVPDLYTVQLHPGDLEALGELAEQVAGELADATLVYARGHGFTLATRPTVALVPDPQVPTGDVRVAASFEAPAGIAAAPVDGDHTMIFAIPEVRAPSAVLRAVSRDGRQNDVRIDGSLLTIGRAADNGLVLDDAKVSRHHARLRARHGMLVLADLDSTNGVRVNGVRVAEVALGVGDRIEIGDTLLVVEAVAVD